ncbi:hypothetical protein FB451DRAFT_1177308 [Mycena latifolia]|nr:hypothetical protein FB451DRAFT_1177308 [Mycena latifolia]
MAAMEKAAEVLQQIHSGMCVAKVDEAMAAIAEQREVANKITELISNPTGVETIPDDELLTQLQELEDEALHERPAGADHVPVHMPEGAAGVGESEQYEAIHFCFRQPVAVTEDDDEAALRQLQAGMAM